MRRQFSTFFLIATPVLWLLYTYIGLRLASGLIAWLALAVPFTFIWLLPPLYWGRGKAVETSWDRLFLHASYVSMGLASFLLVNAIFRDLLLLASMGAGDAPWRTALGGACGAEIAMGLALLMTAVGAASAFLGPRVKEVPVAFPNLPRGLEGLKIAQISDLHVGPTIRGNYVRRVVRKTNDLGADFIALTGDITDGSVDELRAHVAALGELTPRGRVFYVPGNHEYYYDVKAWMAEMARLGATVLTNRGLTVEHGGAKLFIGGVTDPAAGWRQQGDGPDPVAAADGGSGADFRILLAHQPQIAPLAAAAGFDLQLSGHTHAGQFFPWTLVIRLVHKHFGGLSRSGAMQIYVSPGTGSWGPPIRLGSTTEITLLRLVSKL